MVANTDKTGSRRTVVTPEAIPLTLNLADHGTRFGAVLIDLFVLGLLVLAVWILAGLLFWLVQSTLHLNDPFTLALLFGGSLIASFLIRSFYFCWFEIRWRGSTPGKRLLGIRVADRHGGRLTAPAIIARNVMREIELFMPITYLMITPSDQIEAWQHLLTMIWIGVFVLMPFFNRDRLRVGDLVAGTWVINSPKPALLPDMNKLPESNDTPKKQTRFEQSLPEFNFTTAQLAIYGVYELQTLETVLRARGPKADKTRLDVAQRIARKIEFSDRLNQAASQRFLEAFYTAQRARLESDLLMGKRRENKETR